MRQTALPCERCLCACAVSVFLFVGTTAGKVHGTGWWVVISVELRIHICSAAHTHKHTHAHACQVNRKRFDWIREERLSKRIEDRETETEMDKEKRWGQNERTRWQKKLLWDKPFNTGRLHYYIIVNYEFAATFRSVKRARPTNLLVTVISYRALLSRSILLSSLVSKICPQSYTVYEEVYTPTTVAKYLSWPDL